jgi:hypothetical protein
MEETDKGLLLLLLQLYNLKQPQHSSTPYMANGAIS